VIELSLQKLDGHGYEIVQLTKIPQRWAHKMRRKGKLLYDYRKNEEINGSTQQNLGGWGAFYFGKKRMKWIEICGKA
jgi:hypothetical protein